MKTRLIIPALAALLAAACTTDGYNGALPIQKVVIGTATTTTIGTTVVTTCTLSATSNEFYEPNYIPSGAGASLGKAFVGFVVANQLTDPTQLNTTLRTDTTNFNPDVAVVDYQIVGGATIAEQRIPTSSASIAAGESNAVGVPLFAPAAVAAALPANGQVMTTTYIEGHLDDGTTVRTSKHDYLIDVCTTGPTCITLACF